jgi:thiol-disulfide isomerase/thioredoxin
VGVLLNYANFSGVHTGTESVGSDALPTIESTRTTLLFQHVFAGGLGVNLNLPIGLVTRTPNPAQSSEAINRTSGLGDMTLGVRYDLGAHWRYRPSLVAELQLSLPSGTTAKLAAASSATPTFVSLGSGGYALGGRIIATHFVATQLAISANIGARGQLGPGGTGLTFGDTLTYGAGVTWLPIKGVTIGADVAGLVAGTTFNETEAVNGRTGELTSTGGHWLAAELTAGVRVAEGVSLIGRGRLPFWRDVNGTQVTETFSMSFGVVYTWTSTEEESEDDHDAHDHGADEPDAPDPGTHEPDAHQPDAHNPGTHQPSARARADIAVAASGGDSFTVADVVVPGKVTVIDFWATWCAPCTKIAQRLETLAASDSDVAVRTVEAPDNDADVVEEHLGGKLVLPTVWIFDRAGRRQRVLVAATPDAVIEAVQAVLAESPPVAP